MDIDGDDVRPGRGQRQGRGSAYALAGTGDQGNVIGQFHGHVLLKSIASLCGTANAC